MHEVPFVSQQVYGDAEWRRFGCGIASLKMVLDYWHAQDPRNGTDDADALYAAGLAAHAFNPDFGWLHAGLAGLAVARGYESYNLDLGPRSARPMSAPDALAELTRELHSGPVIASVYRSFDPARGGGHLVVITGVSDAGVQLNDPEPAHEREGRRHLPRPEFLAGFKHRYIVVRPRS
jgi:hypothetical protein